MNKESNISLSNMLTKHIPTINLNEDWDPLPEISGSLLGTLLIVTAVLGLLTSILCYIYIGEGLNPFLSPFEAFPNYWNLSQLQTTPFLGKERILSFPKITETFPSCKLLLSWERKGSFPFPKLLIPFPVATKERTFQPLIWGTK